MTAQGPDPGHRCKVLRVAMAQEPRTLPRDNQHGTRPGPHVVLDLITDTPIPMPAHPATTENEETP